jgi:hypothetical protein
LLQIKTGRTARDRLDPCLDPLPQPETAVQLPFSVDQFFEVIRQYNQAVWPAQFLLTALALAAAGFAWSGSARCARPAFAVLSLLWAWMGAVYHLAFFTAINPAAYAFGGLSLAGAAAFGWAALSRDRFVFASGRDWPSAVGAALIGYALVVYPLWTLAGGHSYPDLPTFGLPCPTSIFTIGVLAWVRGRGAWMLFVVPVLWSLVGVQAAFFLTVTPDLGLGVAGLAGMVLAWKSRSGAGQAA